MALDGLVDRVAGKDETLIDRLTTGQDRRLLKTARFIDKVDRVLGPLESTLQVYGGDFWCGVGVALEVAELAFLKVPFAIKYLRRTKDYDALYSWLPKEIFASVVPYGDFIDLTTAYYNRTRNFYESQLVLNSDKQ